MSMHFRTDAFPGDGPIPARHTGEGVDLSPHLAWDTVPAAARSLVVLCEDIDAPSENFPHWVLYDLPPTVRELPEGIPGDGARGLGLQGINGFSTQGWRGPMPPPGEEHRYVFSLLALDHRPELPPGATRDQLEAAMTGHVLQEDSFIGTYRRRSHAPPATPSPRRSRPAAKRRARNPR
jgi:Raf kinase inhibitor-like YbhB/YbcL family protein